MSDLTFAPQIPIALWASLLVLAIVLMSWYGMCARGRLEPRRRAVILALMSISVAIPLFLLLNPTWVDVLPPPEGKPRLTLLLDRSISMATNDVEKGTRYAMATELCREINDSVGNLFDVRLITFAKDATRTNFDTLPG